MSFFQYTRYKIDKKKYVHEKIFPFRQHFLILPLQDIKIGNLSRLKNVSNNIVLSFMAYCSNVRNQCIMYPGYLILIFHLF